MSRSSLLLLLFACTACGASSPSPSLPRTPIHVSTTPMSPGAIVTLTIELPAPAATALDVRVYGSTAGPGSQPCIDGGAVCGGLSDPIDLGTARFFPEMKATSVDATVPKGATTGSTFLLQAIVSSDAGAVASEVASTTLGEVVERPKTVRPERPAGSAAQAPAARPQRSGDCADAGDEVAVASCNAGATGRIDFCVGLGKLDDELYCMAMARKAPDACSQILKEEQRTKCFLELGIAPP